MRKGFIVFMVLLSVFLAIGCTGSNKEQPANKTETPASTPVNKSVTPTETPQTAGGGSKIVDVAIQSFAFNPVSVEISTGDTVKWTNMDSATHIIKGSTFESGSLAKGDTYEFVFTEPGVYDYICSIHPSMKGTVTVVAKK